MENSKGVINLDINNLKKEKEKNINTIINNKEKKNYIFYIIKEELISKFNSYIKLFKDIKGEKINLVSNKNIYRYFMHKYCYSRNLKYLIKKKNIIINNKNKDKFLNYLYYYILFYIFDIYEIILPNSEKLGLLTIDELFKLIITFYSSKILSIYHIINIFKLYLSLLSNNNFQMKEIINILTKFIKLFYKIFKKIKDQETEKQKEVNELIRKEILEKIFEIINGYNNKYNYLYLIHLFRKEESIFLLIKMIVNNDFLSTDNKSFIQENIINFLKNNFRREHLSYFYKLISKILLKFNSLNPKETTNEKDNLIINNYFYNQIAFLTKIIEIITEAIKKELEQINNIYYCDKGFVFNVHEKEKIGFKVNDVLYQKNKKSVLCILFSFLLRNNKIQNQNQIIFSISDLDKEYISLFVEGKKLYLRYFYKKMNKIELLNINYNTYYSFLFYYDKAYIKLCINDKDINPIKESDFRIPNNFQVLVGTPELINNNNIEEFSFNGIIFPILIFELIKLGNEGYNLIKNCLKKIKNNYYLIAEEYFNNKEQEKLNKNGNKENATIDNYKEYYNLDDELEKKQNINTILDNINKIYLYINPYSVLSSFNKKGKSYKDYIVYEIDEKTKKQYSYEFNVIPSLENGQIFSFKDFNIISYFKLNNGLNFIILEIETIYNYLILLNNNDIYREFAKSKKNEFLHMM